MLHGVLPGPGTRRRYGFSRAEAGLRSVTTAGCWAPGRGRRPSLLYVGSTLPVPGGCGLCCLDDHRRTGLGAGRAGPSNVRVGPCSPGLRFSRRALGARPPACCCWRPAATPPSPPAGGSYPGRGAGGCRCPITAGVWRGRRRRCFWCPRPARAVRYAAGWIRAGFDCWPSGSRGAVDRVRSCAMQPSARSVVLLPRASVAFRPCAGVDAGARGTPGWRIADRLGLAGDTGDRGAVRPGRVPVTGPNASAEADLRPAPWTCR